MGRSKIESLGFRPLVNTYGLLYLPYACCWRAHNSRLGPQVFKQKIFCLLCERGGQKEIVLSFDENVLLDEFGRREAVLVPRGTRTTPPRRIRPLVARILDIETVGVQGVMRAGDDNRLCDGYYYKDEAGAIMALGFELKEASHERFEPGRL